MVKVRSLIKKIPWSLIVVALAIIITGGAVGGYMPWWARIIGTLCGLFLLHKVLTEK